MMISNAPVANIISVMIAPYLHVLHGCVMQSYVPTVIIKSVLIAVGGTVEVATMICHGRLVGSAKKKPVDIVLNITA